MRESALEAVVTGGGGALGRAVVADLLEGGARVQVPVYHPSEGEQLRALAGGNGNRLVTRACDLAEESGAETFFREAGPRLDVLACMAGGFAWNPLEQADGSTLKRMLAMNLDSVYHSVRCALPALKAAAASGPLGGARVVTVGALPALYAGGANMAAYTASKSALLGLTRALAEELLPFGITVNAVVPTIIDTPANRASMPDADTRHWLPPAGIARVIRFLAGPDSALLTGAALTLAR